MYIGCSTKNTHSEATISLFFQRDNHFHALVMMIADASTVQRARRRPLDSGPLLRQCILARGKREYPSRAQKARMTTRARFEMKFTLSTLSILLFVLDIRSQDA